jgi:hypothetical protein
LITIGTPGRLGITITGPLSACAGAIAKAATPASTNATQAVTRRDMKLTRFNVNRGILDELFGKPDERRGGIAG